MEIKNLRFTAANKSTPLYFQTEYTPITGENLQEAIGDEYLAWKPIHPVFIDAPTGFGKSTYIKERIIPHAIKNNKNVLIVSNRIALNVQQKKEIVDQFFPDDAPTQDFNTKIEQCSIFGSIGLVTYQGLLAFLSGKNNLATDFNEWFSKLGYAVFDEVHFFYSDALFNSLCGSVLKKIPHFFKNAVRIYMTATPWEIIDRIAQVECQERIGADANFLKYAKPYVPTAEKSVFYRDPDVKTTFIFKYYCKEFDYSKYNLHFFGNDLDCPTLPLNHPARGTVRSKSLQALIAYMNPLPSPQNKWLVFVDQKRIGQHLKNALVKIRRPDGNKIKASFLEAGSNKNTSVWKTLISKTEFHADVLISTSVIENGVNIKDPCIHNIAIFCTERTTFIQELGRKRKTPEETIDLWVWVPSKKQLAGKCQDLDWTIRTAKKLLNGSTQEEKTAAIKAIWDSRFKIQYSSLFYINNNGAFSVNQYVLDILESQYQKLLSIYSKRNRWTFQDEVESWLKRKAIEPYTNVPDSVLPQKMKECEGMQLSEEEFVPIRQMIVQEVSNNHIEYIREKRRGNLSAKSLNRYLDILNVPFHVQKAKKQWTIVAIEPFVQEQPQ